MDGDVADRDLPGIEKAPTGIEGFDEITGGGLPRGRTTLILGDVGTGKTIFALQTLVNGARQGEPGIFVAFEEHSRQIVANAATFGWDLAALERHRLFFLDARLPADVAATGGFDLAGMLAGIEAKAREMGAKRIVFDSIDVLLSLLNDPTSERREVYRLHDWLSHSGMTGIVTRGAASAEDHWGSRFGFMRFMADCVVLLRHYVADRVSVREARVVKYRGTSFAENEVPMVIGRTGIEMAAIGSLNMGYQVSNERISTGVERLDGMLDGGYYRGTSVLITGAPGTSKTSLAGAFTEAACLRGERALYVSFDEASAEIVRNLASIGIDLAPHLESGLLSIQSFRSELRGAEEHLAALRELMRQHRPHCMVVDPLSAMLKAGGLVSAMSAAQRLLYWSKAEGVTLLFTSLLEATDPETEATELRISTIADTWIHVTYVVQGGERNRALTVVKSRGTRHSNQVRELILSDEGITLADVYSAQGQVLMGTLRWQQEEAERVERRRRQLELEHKRRELEAAEAEAEARMRALELELELRRAESAALAEEHRAWDRQSEGRTEETRQRRSGE